MPSPYWFWPLPPIQWRAGCTMTHINICCISRGYSEPSEQALLKQEQRSAPTTASGWRSGYHRLFMAMTGRLRRLLQKAWSEKGPKSPPSSSERNIIGQASLSLIGVEALHRNKGCGAALLQHQLRQCDQEHLPAYLWSSNPLNTSLYERHGFEIVGAIRVGSSPLIFPMLRNAR